MTQKKKGDKPNVERVLSEDELRIAHTGTAAFSNKVYVSTTPFGVRIAFCEERADLDVLEFRSAIYMPIPDALALRDILNRNLEGVRFEIEKAELPTSEGEDGEAPE